MNANPRLVHVVFKTHLDIGFTDLAANVTENYIREFIPKSIKTAVELRRRGGKERFVWTTGSWLIHTYLKRADEKSRDEFVRAIQAGDIVWHALPFTTHTELMDYGLCDYGLSLSAALDKRFGKTTIAAKMTDVPGHTIGLVPLLARRGIQYLHIGVNGGSHLPETPRVFRWQAVDGSEVIVQYDRSYGETLTLPGLDEALVIVNSSDNQGPPRTESILRIFEVLSKQFPGAEIRASTLSDFVPALRKAAVELPVVTAEIGDTWIHGIGSDPAKVARFRELLRLRKSWAAAGALQPGSEAYQQFYDELIMIPEHTWGLDIKKYLGDYTNWSVEDFHRARRADKVSLSSIPAEYEAVRIQTVHELETLYPGRNDLRERQGYAFFESSHREQRAYLDTAVGALPEGLKKEAAAAFKTLEPERALHTGAAARYPGDRFELGPWEAVIGDSGAIVSLREKSGGRELAAPVTGIGAYSYQTFSAEDFARYHQDYNRNMDINGAWVGPDFGKPGMQHARPRAVRAFYGAHIRSITTLAQKDYDEAEVSLQASAGDPRGAPRNLIIRYRAHKKPAKLELCLDWFDKEATRLPEALWLGINLNAAIPGQWRFSKLGALINPLDVVKGGNRSYHGIESAEYRSYDGRYVIRPLDSPLAAIGKPKMLQFDDRFEDPAGGIHFNLYNNIWGTNFPVWYGENGRSRFIIEF
jgi:hypothetical protein